MMSFECLSPYNITTKEDYYSLIIFIEKIFNIDYFFDEYGYSIKESFGQDFYNFIKNNHFITNLQNTEILSMLMRSGDDVDLDSFSDILLKDVCSDYEDVATLTEEEFKAIYAWFVSDNDCYGKMLLEEIKESNDNLNWDYLFNNIPDSDFPEIEVQEDLNCTIPLKDVNKLKSGIESLESITEELEDNDIMLEIINSMKKILDKIV